MYEVDISANYEFISSPRNSPIWRVVLYQSDRRFLGTGVKFNTAYFDSNWYTAMPTTAGEAFVATL